MSTLNHATGKSIRNPEIMKAAVEGVRDGLTTAEVAKMLGMTTKTNTTVEYAFVVVRDAPDLVERVISGEMSIYKAHQMTTKGAMHPCPVCEGKGYVFRKRR